MIKPGSSLYQTRIAGLAIKIPILPHFTVTRLKAVILFSITIALIAAPSQVFAINLDNVFITTELDIYGTFAGGNNLVLDSASFTLGGVEFMGIRGAIARAIFFLLSIISIVALGGIVYGGLMYILAFGNDSKVQLAKSIIISSLIGFAVAILSIIILRIISTIIGGTTPTPWTDATPVFLRARIFGFIMGVLSLMSFLAFGAVIYGGFQYITAAGNEDRAKRGKTVLIYVVIGMIIVAMSGALVNAIFSIF